MTHPPHTHTLHRPESTASSVLPSVTVPTYYKAMKNSRASLSSCPSRDKQVGTFRGRRSNTTESLGLGCASQAIGAGAETKEADRPVVAAALLTLSS